VAEEDGVALLAADFGYGAERSRADEEDWTVGDRLDFDVVAFRIEVEVATFDCGTATLDGLVTEGG
jgi:hypothetical protein